MGLLWLIQHPWQSGLVLITFLIFLKTLGDIIWLVAVTKLAQALEKKGYDQIEIGLKRIILVKRKASKKKRKSSKF